MNAVRRRPCTSRSAVLVALLTASLQACGSPSNPYQLGTTPAKVLSLGGDYQTGQPRTPLPLPLGIKVVDADGRPVPGVTVNWIVTAGDASVAPATDTTDIGGKVTATVDLGYQLGVSEIQARVASDTSLLALFTAIASGRDTTGALSTPSLQVTVGDNYFDPSVLRIELGQTVKWVWVGQNYHDLVFSDTSISAHAGFNGRVVGGTAGLIWSWTFNKPGTFEYHDTVYGAQGTIVVQQ